jgi:molybdopterin-binding protein
MPSGTALNLSGLTWAIGGRPIVDVGDLELQAGERLVVYGPNGAGKSTLLRLAAGILGERNGDEVSYMPQRPFMFRGSGRHNLLLGLEDAESNKAEMLAKRLGVSNVLGSPAARLSGGERQRLALARTLASSRPVVALDEPLAAIDAQDRDEVSAIIGDALGHRAALLVTHDSDVVVAFADRVAVMAGGRVLQVGPAQEVLLHPGGDDIAEVLGFQNILAGTVVKSDGPLVQVACSGLMVWARGTQASGSDVRVTFGAESVTLHFVSVPEANLAQDSARNHWLGPILTIEEVGRLIEVVVDVGQPVAALITAGSMEGMSLGVGDRVALSVKATAAHALTAAKQ